jgi:hypothetical protein
VEAAYNEVLQGQPGTAIYERDTTGEPIPTAAISPRRPGPARISSSPSIASSSRWPKSASPSP